MSKKNKNKKKESEVVTPAITTISSSDKKRYIEKYLKKYQLFDVVTEEVLDNIISNIGVTDNGFALEADMTIDREINLYICKQIREGENEDLIFYLEDQYKGLLSMVLKKYGIKNEELTGVMEEILLEMVFVYDGSDSFTLYFSRFAREYLNKKKEANKPSLEKILKDNSKLEEAPKIDDLTYIGNQLQFIHSIPLDNPIFIKFVAYKFGFLGYYASDGSIMINLGLDKETFDAYLEQAYQYLNQSLNEQFELITRPKEKIKTS